MLSAAIFFALLTSAIAQQAAIVVRPPEQSTAIATQTVKFTCVAYGNPLPSVQWSSVSGRNLSSSGSDDSAATTVTITDQQVTSGDVTMLVSVLELCNVDASFADTYSCTASNGVTTGPDPIASPTANFTLAVTQPITAPPAIVLRPPPRNSVGEGQTVQVTCVAYGNPVPNIYWSKPGCLKITNNTDDVYVFSDMITVGGITMRRSSLQICSAGADDSTQYSCWADNGVSGMNPRDAIFDFSIGVVLRSPTPSTATEEQVLVVDAAVPYVVVMGLLIVAVIVLLVAVVLLGIYSYKKSNLQPKTNYAVTMGAVNQGSEGYEVTVPDDQQLIEDDIKYDLTLDAEDEGTDTQ